MAGGARKHGAHRIQLNIPLAAAGSASDLVGDVFTYDGFAESGGGGLASPTAGYDLYSEAVIEASVATYVAFTGQATNFASLRLTHARNAVTQNQIEVTFSGTGIVTAALVPMNFGVASGAVVPGAGTGTLTVVTGTALPWTLQPGDTITLDRLSNNATGLATPAVSATITIAGKGA